MPIARPQFNKTLQRVKLQAELDSVMDFTHQSTTTSARALKLISTLFDRTIQHLKNETMEEFFKKQPQVGKDLNSLVGLIDELKKGLDDLKNQSPTLKEFLETVNIDDIEKNASEFIGKLENLTLNDSKIHSNGNGVKANGDSNGHGHTNGKANGVSHKNLVIDPFKYEPEPPKIPKDKSIECDIAYIHSPSDFYVHPYGGVAAFTMNLQREQDKLIQKGITSLDTIEVGMFCAARFHEDYYWYRARIIDVIHPKGNPNAVEKVKVFYLDYGNTSEVELENIMPMAASVANQKLMAVNCHFVHYDPVNGWPAEATKAMKEKINNEPVKVYFNKPSPRISDNGNFLYFPVDLYLMNDTKVFDAIRKFTQA
ncbi:maternal protein tudor-like [Panonychus citri]|uniref:maternal protein tudor-like n=1 Tax=Panonychus citri TaxID=50023 RepID=UPI002307D2D6|nr:maternal protein tudor-like [Panonychus citri]